MSHTPGPWHVEAGSVWAEAADGSHLRIAQPWAVLNYVSMSERNANANLIAAAPELLEALKALIDEERDHCGALCNTDNCPWERAIIVLAKAERGQ